VFCFHPKGYYYSDLLQQFPAVAHGFSTRRLGNMSFEVGDSTRSLENRLRFFELLSFSAERFVTGEQVHSNHVYVATNLDAGKGAVNNELLIPQTDGLVTNEQNVYVGNRAGDCSILLLHDPLRGVVGSLHVGWRGLTGEIIQGCFQEMEHTYGSTTNNVFVSVGPTIGACCYEVKEDFLQEMKKVFSDTLDTFLYSRDGKMFFDLKQAVVAQLEVQGVLREHIDVCDLCTKDHRDTFFSVRNRPNESEEQWGLHMGVIGLR
jgi:YfiH family protein